MERWEISNQEIESTEKLLLPENAHFPEDARDVIRCWHSVDVSACPGSGKTTVLLAKLKLLADRMPLKNGAGICVLSHTNVAVKEIKNRLSGYADKLIAYPNYIGTIQSFIDKFVTMPYLRNITGHNVQVIDDLPYVRQMLKRIYDEKKYEKLKYVIRNSYLSNKQFADIQTFVQALYLRDDGSLCVGNQKKALAGAGKPSTQQFNILIEDLLMKDGIIRFHDAYSYAQKAIDTLSETYTDLFPLRFRYVFIDEYQDCDIIQRKALMKIFDSEKCSVMNIGDPDQAIYNSSNSKVPDWDPRDGFLPIQTSCRYSQEIADAICKLKTGNKEILTFTGNTGIKPVLIVFDPKKIDRVLGGFISALETHGLHDCQGIYKAVGAVRKDTGAGLKIGSYWSEFDSFPKKQGDYNYWELVEQIKTCLLAGDLYKAECIVRKLLCRLFHYAKIVNADSGKEYTVYTIKKTLNEEYRDIYRQWIFDLSRLQNLNTENVDSFLRKEVNELLKIRNPQAVDVFEGLPEFFLDRTDFRTEKEACERNVFVDPIRGRRIMFDTIHGVKGETHDATLSRIRWSSLMYQRNNKNYEMLINICYFVLDGMLQTTDKGNYKMMTFSDEHMHRLYEKFVLEYFKRHHSYLSEVRAAQVKWNLATDTEESMIRFLPAMQTDIFLRYKEKVLIIDTKYYGNSMQKQYDKVTIHSGNMYQIFTYVKNQDVENNGRVSGMLLYAKTEEAITPDCSFVIGGNKISVKTVDLNKEFKLIAAQLDKIAEDYFGKKRIEDSII